MNSVTKVGIIGFGDFGKFAASVLAPYASIYAYDHNGEVSPSGVTPMSIEMVAEMDALILAIPLAAYESALIQLKPYLRTDTLVIDVCSVKVKSRDIMLRSLDGHAHILVCHPLFGPLSAQAGVEGHDIIVTNVEGERAEQAVAFCRDVLRLNVHEITAEEHDHVMAYVHVLTFFVARGLGNMDIRAIPFKTPSYDMITALIDFNAKHSDELFMTIQQGNPYADVVRRELVESFERLENSLLTEKGSDSVTS